MRIRAATIDDARILFDWRNDPLTREMSRNTAMVDWLQHIGWLTAWLARPRPNLFIAELAEPVGTFRVDDDEVSYTVAPAYRGGGIGTQMLIEARKMFGPLRAEIFERNEASIKIAERAGMVVRLLATSHSTGL